MDEIPTATLDDGETMPEEFPEEEVVTEPQDNEVEIPDIPIEEESIHSPIMRVIPRLRRGNRFCS